MRTSFKFFFYTLATIIILGCDEKIDLNSDFSEVNTDFIFPQSTVTFIDIEEAKSIANQFMNLNNSFRKGEGEAETERIIISSSVVRSEKRNINIENECDTLMYIFNFSKGFTIVSAIKDFYPILAYSEDNCFDESNTDNVGPSIWLDYMRNTIEKMIEDPNTENVFADVYHSMQFEENELTQRTRSQFYDEIRNYVEVGPYLTTEWHQGYPFNTCTPVINGDKAPAGCVPIAVAQVVNYHRILTGENINWTAVNNEVSPDVGNLIAIISNDIEMSYEEDYAYPSLCFPDFFCYRGRIANYLNNKGYNVNWRDIGTQTPVTCPAIYEGFTSNFLGTTNWFGGHWWVMDGYKKWEWWYGWAETENPIEPRSGSQLQDGPLLEQYPPLTVTGFLYLHFNWGWGGQSNGWYGAAGSYLDYCKSFKRLDIRRR